MIFIKTKTNRRVERKEDLEKEIKKLREKNTEYLDNLENFLRNEKKILDSFVGFKNHTKNHVRNIERFLDERRNLLKKGEAYLLLEKNLYGRKKVGFFYRNTYNNSIFSILFCYLGIFF